MCLRIAFSVEKESSKCYESKNVVNGDEAAQGVGNSESHETEQCHLSAGRNVVTRQ